MNSPSDPEEDQQALGNWAAFGQRYGVDIAAVKAPPFRQATPTILVRPGRRFTGQVEALRVVRYGRFGNNFYQVLNAAMLAQGMGCALLEIPEIDHGPENLPVKVDTVTITYYSDELAADSTLRSSLYWPNGMEAVLSGYSAAVANQTIERYLRPLYRAYCDHAPALGDDVLVLNFRGGDVFAPGTFAMMYVQPPASYYIKSIDYAQRHLGVTKIHLVYEDKANPSVDVVLNYLADRGIPHSCQRSRPGSKVFDDASALIGARHLVACYSTFCEATALLSNVLKSYIAFRRVGSQRFIPFWAQARCEDMLVANGVRTVVIDDPDRSYIQEGGWFNTEDQRALMCDYPIEKLQVIDRR